MAESLATVNELDESVDVKESKDALVEKLKVARKATQMPRPTGYKILIALPEPDEKTDGGIIKPSQTLHTEEVGSIVGFVLDMGPDVYSDSARFPTGSFCKKGDWIVMRSYTGTRFSVHGKEFRLINDDSVEAVVEDPRGIVKI
jgi:co-chaperonin GroES (HSP10)|tara:strand:- start:768 stop:1199 length:432 start_codon:yes stop_codon:yes gene_type:complete